MEKSEVLTFKDAVDFVSSYDHPIPPDILLRLYAYYKIASEEKQPNRMKTLIDGFKANAILQNKSLSSDEAKKAYLKLVLEKL